MNKIQREVLDGSLGNQQVKDEIENLLAVINTENGTVTSYNEYLDTDSFCFIITITYKV